VLQIPLPFRNRTCSKSHYHNLIAHAPDRDKINVIRFRELLAFLSIVRTELAKESSDTAKIASLLDAARSDTRRSHANSVKKSIGDWHSFNPGLSKKPTAPWGWDHKECARLLCPLTIEWNEAYVIFLLPPIFSCYCRNEWDLRDPVKRAKFKLGPGDFLRFLWEGETLDDDKPGIGFLRHPILFAVSISPQPYSALTMYSKQALRHFAVSPSSGVDPTSNMSTKSGYAKKCGVKHVTVESIAYAATMVASHYCTIAVANVISRFVMG